MLGLFTGRVEEGGGIVLDASSDVDHERSVVTFVAAPERVVAIGTALLALARDRIDLGARRGCHPRIGACDVFPLIALEGVSEKRCVALAHELGHEVGGLGVPVYFYGKAARRPQREALPEVRRGGFEGLARALEAEPPEASRLPDEGPQRLHPRAGAVAVGVRPFLIAFNVVLGSSDPAAARVIARRIRASSGGLPGIRALGFELPSRALSQVSVNVCDHERTGLVALFERVEHEARTLGVGIVESELIGLAPRAALDADIARRVRLVAFDPTRHVLEERLAHRDR